MLPKRWELIYFLQRLVINRSVCIREDLTRWMLDKDVGLVDVNLHPKTIIGGVIGIGCSLKAIWSMTWGGVSILQFTY